MATFTKTGEQATDFWLADGSKTFSIFPANTVEAFPRDIPIRLHVGNSSYGQIHTEKHWKFKSAGNRTIPQLIHFKLGQSGTVYMTEAQKKMKITLGVTPGGLMLLEYRYQHDAGRLIDEYFSVTTFYANRAPVDGDKIGRYLGRPRIFPQPNPAPVAPTQSIASNSQQPISTLED
ncbi:hypothetical protein ACQ4WQ_00425 [Janthinobacterium sp. GB1R12]|uniref:hypothetical protein n=1 Tax=Janthinobacterium sp. GB1R12 TaxID=3424190 RepID=UPI003F20CD1F